MQRQESGTCKKTGSREAAFRQLGFFGPCGMADRNEGSDNADSSDFTGAARPECSVMRVAAG